MIVNTSSRTPEGEPNRCPVCGNEIVIEPSVPAGDAPCPNCGVLLWFRHEPSSTLFFEASQIEPVFEEVKSILASYLGMKKDEITLTTPLRRSSDPFAPEVGIDSLDLVELVMALEEQFSTTLPDAVAQALEFETVWDLCAWIVKHRLK